ncbi:T9SS type A sorting domain-containing protein [Balneolales bacterium ANBcel1]|nr:T9SS type A sorting domain-containing protein [Balneolales bacterium ANBcel1]
MNKIYQLCKAIGLIYGDVTNICGNKRLSAMILGILLSSAQANAEFAAGSGTGDNPYQIETIEQLQKIDEYPAAHFVLMNDIDASETADWNGGKGFKPLQFIDFHFDGGGHVITGLTINRGKEDEVGLFGSTGNAVIVNLGLEDINVTGDKHVGGLVGHNSISVIKSCYVVGKVTGDNTVGGLIGTLAIDGNPEGHEYWVMSSYTDVFVMGSDRVGGLIGGTMVVWPLWGMMRGTYQSFAMGEVVGGEDTGGLFGDPFMASISESYWGIETTGQNDGIGSETDADITGLITEQMTGQDAFIHMYKLDFDNTWQLTGGHPVLKWQDPDNAVDQPLVSIIRIDTAKRDFGRVSTDSSGIGEVAIRNTGNTSLSGEVYLAGADSGPFAIDNEFSSFSLEAGSSQDVAITFHPESADSYEAEMHIVHDAPNRSDTLIVPLVGEGKEPTFAMPDSDRPQKVALYQNYPNPFNPVTVIRYDLLEGRQVSLVVYDVMGRRVATLIDRTMPAGSHTAHFDASDLAGGVYLYHLTTGDFVQTRQMMLIK